MEGLTLLSIHSNGRHTVSFFLSSLLVCSTSVVAHPLHRLLLHQSSPGPLLLHPQISSEVSVSPRLAWQLHLQHPSAFWYIHFTSWPPLSNSITNCSTLAVSLICSVNEHEPSGTSSTLLQKMIINSRPYLYCSTISWKQQWTYCIHVMTKLYLNKPII